MKGRINETSYRTTLVNEEIIKLEKQLGNRLKRDVVAFLKDLQKHKVDPLGFGDLARSTTRGWKAEEWYKKIYPKVVFDVKVEFNVAQTGIIE